ncbi:hypothetical protein AMECASPLE_013941 [Ameca splendens]|uniref:Uncharacterized protein n=1 Tax=Ameca splendens TaxID=208324 RepID=A0ABV0XQC0_9TELE
MGERQGTPWTGHQSVAGQHTNNPNRHVFGLWEEAEYPVRTHACTGRTCKLHAERPPAENRTQDLLAARQQCYQLRHRAAQLLVMHFSNLGCGKKWQEESHCSKKASPVEMVSFSRDREADQS